MTMKKARALLEKQLQLSPGELQPAKQMCAEVVDQVCATKGAWVQRKVYDLTCCEPVAELTDVLKVQLLHTKLYRVAASGSSAGLVASLGENKLLGAVYCVKKPRMQHTAGSVAVQIASNAAHDLKVSERALA